MNTCDIAWCFDIYMYSYKLAKDWMILDPSLKFKMVTVNKFFFLQIKLKYLSYLSRFTYQYFTFYLKPYLEFFNLHCSVYLKLSNLYLFSNFRVQVQIRIRRQVQKLQMIMTYGRRSSHSIQMPSIKYQKVSYIWYFS